MRWSTGDIRYLEEHAGDGAASVAAALGRSERAVRTQASRLGLSLRPRWLCPSCGRKTYSPLSGKTGWCAACTKAARAGAIAEEVREMERDAARQEEASRARQRLYSRKSRAKKKLKTVKQL